MNPFPKQPSQQPQVNQQQLLQMLKSNPQLMKKYQEQMTKMQQKNGTRKNIQPMTNQEYSSKVKNSTIDECLDEEGGLVIQPQSGFVLKFLEKKNKEKIFVNIVKHHAIDHPQEKILIDFQNQPGLRIPMSMGRVKDANDKSGTPCRVVDVVLNPQIVSTASINSDVLQFTAQIISNYLLQKYKIVISDEMVRKVKGIKYKGTNVEIQRVKAKKNPKIEQLSEQTVQLSKEQRQREEKLLDQLSEPTKKAMKPDFKVFYYDKQGNRGQYSVDILNKICKMQIIFDLPHLIHSRAIHLQGSNKLLYMQVRGFYQICLKIPIQVTTYKSIFGKQQRKLVVEIIVKTVEIENKQKKQSLKKLQVQFDNELLDEIV